MREVRVWWHRCGDTLFMGTPPSMGPHWVSRPTGHLKLTDFGLSRHLHWGERAHTICGTLQYMGKGAAGGAAVGGTASLRCSPAHPRSPRGAERGPLQPRSRLVVPGSPALRPGQRGGEDHRVGGIGAPRGAPKFALCPPSPQFPVAPAGDHVAMLERVKQSSYESPPALSPALARLLAEVTLLPRFWGPRWPPKLDADVPAAHCPPSVPSCCATTPCAACATSTTSRATPSSVGWPSTPICCRRTRWRWRWPRPPPSSPRLTLPPSPTSTATSQPPRAGPGLAEPPRPGPPASLRDIPPPPRQWVGPCWAGCPLPRHCTSPRGSNKPESRGHRCGCCPHSCGTPGESGTPRGCAGLTPLSQGAGQVGGTLQGWVPRDRRWGRSRGPGELGPPPLAPPGAARPPCPALHGAAAPPMGAWRS